MKRLIRYFCHTVCWGAAGLAGANAWADRIELFNGDVLSGRVVARTDEAVTLEHPVLGKVVIQADRIKPAGPTRASSTKPNTPQADPPATQAEPTPRSKPASTQPKKKTGPPARDPQGDRQKTAFKQLLKEWNSRLTLGLNGVAGNTERQNYRVMFNARKTEGRDRWEFNSRWVYAFADGRQNQNQFETNLTREWLQEDSQWFFFLKGEYEYDQRRSFLNRTSGFGGGGYTLANSEDVEINTRMGFGGTYEYGSINDFTPEALFGGSVVRWEYSDRASLAGEALLYPSLDDRNDYRIESSLEWIYKLDMAKGLSLKLGLENEYESDARQDRSSYDLRYYGAIVLNF